MVPITMHPNQGWQCPACKRCWAPSIPFCDCAKNAAVSSATTTTSAPPANYSIARAIESVLFTVPHVSTGKPFDAFIKTEIEYDDSGLPSHCQAHWEGGQTAGISGAFLKDADRNFIKFGDTITIGDLTVRAVGYSPEEDVYLVTRLEV